MENRQYNLESVSAGVPSLPSITTTALTEADNMSTEKEPTGFGREWLASLLDVDPDMSVMDYFNGDLKAPKVSTTDVAKLAGNKPAVQLQQTASQVVPLQGTMPYINQGTVDRGLLESLNPAMSIQEAAYNDANQSVIQPTNIPHASEFGQAYVVPNTGPTAEELSAGAGSYVVPIGREPAGVAVEQQQGILEDQFGKPVRSGNKNVIGLPTQNPAYQAPAGGKGANATPQSAIDQLTGIKGFGGK
jgi:hypothetical protein